MSHPTVRQIVTLARDWIENVMKFNPGAVDIEGRQIIKDADALLAGDIIPIDMILFCPACGHQHIDAPDGEEMTIRRQRAASIFRHRWKIFGIS